MMRQIIIILGLLFFNMLSAQDNESCKDLSTIIEMETRHHEKKAGFRNNVLTNNYDLKYHRLEWEVDPNERYIKGKVTSYFVPTNADFQQINFDFSHELIVNQISYHGNSLSFSLSAEDNLQIELPAIIPLGQLDSITIVYEGVPTSTGFGSFATSTHNSTPVMWTLSEPYGAKEWWPCKQDLTDKIDSIDIIVRVREAYRVASNGILLSEKLDATDKIFHWKHRYAIPAYLIAIAVTDYAVYSDFVPLDNGKSVEVLNYVYPENFENAQIQTKNIVEIMDLYNKLFGNYPFADEKYGHAQFGWGGGMEHQTMSFMGSFSYGLQAHELAHQWFGDKVTCGSWEDIWLNEGFATYLTGLTDEFLGSDLDWYHWKSRKIKAITKEDGGSVWVDDTTRVGRIFNSRLSYSKGAMLLHMLRWKLGDDDFFEGIRNYLDDPKLAYGFAKTTHLQKHLEVQSGLELSEFFEDWFYNQGYPSYHTAWWKNNSGITILLQQATSHSSVDFFEMPVPIYVSGEGQDSMLRLEHTSSAQIFQIDLPFEVDSVSFDPDLWLISNNNSTSEVLDPEMTIDNLQQYISVFPNPVRNELSIKINATNVLLGKVEIIDAIGRKLTEFIFSENNFTINTKEWIPGLYILNFYSGGILLSKKIIKRP